MWPRACSEVESGWAVPLSALRLPPSYVLGYRKLPCSAVVFLPCPTVVGFVGLPIAGSRPARRPAWRTVWGPSLSPVH